MGWKGAGAVALALVVVTSVGGPAAEAGPRRAVGAAGVSGAPGPAAAPASGDFDGDGYDDLVLGTPLEDEGTIEDSGEVTVVYGSPTGLAPERARTFRQGVAPVPGAAEAGDFFGGTVAAGDLDGDGYDDLAVAAYGEGIGTTIGSGNVTVLFGSSSGLGGRRRAVVRQGSGAPDRAETDDAFGWTLAVADVVGDPVEDLVVGAPGENQDTGTVTVLPGSPSGPVATGALVLRQGKAGVPGVAEVHDGFGAALAVGDMDGDGRLDLAVGAELEDAGTMADTGNVSIWFGVPPGARHRPGQVVTKATGTGERAPGDLFGWALATGDPDADGDADLVVSTLNHRGLDGVAGAGLVQLFAGGPGGLSWGGWAKGGWTDELLGWALSMADVDGDGRDDVVVGAPNRDHGDVVDAGGAYRCAATAEGIEVNCALRAQGYIDYLPGVAEEGDVFGTSLAAGDYDGDGYADVAYGAQAEDIGAIADAGNVTVGYGERLEDRRAPRILNQTTVGQVPEAGDRFGLAAG